MVGLTRVMKAPYAGSTLVAQKALAGSNDNPVPVIHCPEKFIIGPRLAQDLFPEAWATASDPVKQSLIKLSLLREKAKGDTSIYKQYIDALPKQLDSPIFWSEEEQEWLRGSNVFGEIAVKVEQWRQEWEVLRTSVFASTGKVDGLVFEDEDGNEGGGAYGFEAYKWACGIFMSRAFPARVVYTSPQDQTLTMLVPGVDALNHKPRAAVLWDGTSGVGGFTVSVCAPVAAGAEVFNNYGPKSNEELLLGYGFCCDDAVDFDAVLLKLNLPPWLPNRREVMLKSGAALDPATADNAAAAAVVFRLVQDGWTPEQGGLGQVFCALARGPQYAGLPVTVAETLRGFDALEAALRQKHHALAMTTGSDDLPDVAQSVAAGASAARLGFVQLYRRTQAQILSRCIEQTRAARTQVLTTRTTTDDVLDLVQVLGDNEHTSADPYFGDLRAAVLSVYAGLETVSDFFDSDCIDAVLTLITCSERLQGSSSRFFSSLSRAWSSSSSSDDNDDGPFDAEDAQSISAAIFPPGFNLAEAVAQFPSVFHSVELWTPEFMAAGLKVVDRHMYEDQDKPGSVRLLF